MFQTMTRQGGFWHVCELPLSMSFVMREHGKRKKVISGSQMCRPRLAFSCPEPSLCYGVEKQPPMLT